MKLWQTRRHWEKFARTDPLWAVLTAPGKEGNRWALDEFFATGEQDIAAALAAIHRNCPQLAKRQALDFGCGVGRLTQALAGKFDHVTGVDIAVDMVALARQHNRHGERVTYVHNPAADLACFADGSFDLVLSLITLQHVAPEYSRRYLAEFVRVCAPGGIAYFQVPASASAAPKPGRISFYPPTLAKKFWRLLNRSFAVQPTMEMHVLPRDEVIALIRAAGGQVLATDACPKAGEDFVSYAYVIRKP
jgi:ubiquinone/menaquinone biosynthesis C-methylase UbiE